MKLSRTALFSMVSDVGQSIPSSSAHHPETGGFTPAGLRILLVEDLPINRLVVEKLLKIHGYRIARWAANGEAALRALREGHFDLALMDCQMPGMDGFEATRRIRAGEGGDAHRSLPIIALTANAHPGIEAQCRMAGMNRHLVKPFKIEAVLSALRSVMAER
jgi:CheY-like chemotaxis protein